MTTKNGGNGGNRGGVLVTTQPKPVLAMIDPDTAVTEWEKDRIQAMVTLKKAAGDLCELGRDVVITAQGFKRMNSVIGLISQPPPTLVVDGVAQSNPRVERDLNHPNKKVIGIWARNIVIGPTPAGAIVAIPRTVYLDMHSLFLERLQNVVEKHPTAGHRGLEGQKPEKVTVRRPKFEWKRTAGGKSYKENVGEETVKVDFSRRPMKFFEEEDGVGLWVDVSYPEVGNVFHQMTKLRADALAKVQTVAERNCLKAHPAINRYTVGSKDLKEFPVKVYGFRDWAKYGLAISRLIATGEIKVDMKRISVASEQTERVGASDLDTTVGEEAETVPGQVIDAKAEEVKEEPPADETASPEPSPAAARRAQAGNPAARGEASGPRGGQDEIFPDAEIEALEAFRKEIGEEGFNAILTAFNVEEVRDLAKGDRENFRKMCEAQLRAQKSRN